MSENFLNKPLEDEVSLREIIDFLLDSWKTIAISGLVGGLLATLYAFVLPPKYYASASIEVATVAGNEVESAVSLLEKIKLPMYFSAESHSACNVIGQAEPGKALVSNLNPGMAKLAPIITFSYTENSPEVTLKCLESILHDIRNNQALLAKPILENKKNQLTKLRQKLDTAERDFEKIPNKNLSFDFSDTKFSSYTFFFATISKMKNEIQILRDQINDLETSLLEPQTKETFLVTPIYGPRRSPNNFTLISIGGVVAGLFLGLLFFVGKRSWHAYKASH